MTRREAIRAALFSTAAFAAALRVAHADTPPTAAMPTPALPNLTLAPAPMGPFTVPPLPYAFDALEPYIDAQTMTIHHDKHHAAYVKNLNAAVAKMPGAVTIGSDPAALVHNLLLLGAKMPPGLPLMDPSDPTFKAIRNNGGGHYNHSLFWPMMRPTPKVAQALAAPLTSTRPTKDMASAIEKQFGSYTQFQDQFTKAALGQFGSGWAWLSLGSDGTLKVESTANQDSPWMLGRTPLLGIDVWEHAYYLKYQNRRPEYVAAWYNTVHWDFVNDRFTQAKKAAKGA